jgi:hypothetical protein
MLEWPSSLEITVAGVPACSSSAANVWPEAVRVDALVDPGPGRQAVQQVADVLRVQLAAAERAEQRAAPQAELLSGVHPPGERVGGARVEAAGGGLAALAAEHADSPRVQADVRLAQCRPASTRRVYGRILALSGLASSGPERAPTM